MALFLLIGASAMYAQNYTPLVVENAHWFEYVIDANLDPNKFEQSYFYSIRGDTNYINETYKKLYFQNLRSINNDGNFPLAISSLDTPKLCALLREDTIAKIVYCIAFDKYYTFKEKGTFTTAPCPINQEVVLYDFSLIDDDSLSFCLGSPFSIDTVYNQMVFGANRKIFVLKGFLAYYSEGIGSLAGLFHTMTGNISNVYYSLYDFCIGTNADCGIQYLDQTEETLSKKSIYPNPVSHALTISGFDESSYILYNSQGQIVMEGILDDTHQILIEYLPKGVYYLFIKSKTHRIVII